MVAMLKDKLALDALDGDLLPTLLSFLYLMP